LFRKIGAARKLDYKILSANIRFYPGSIRLITTLGLINNSAENLQVKKITGVLKVNGLEAAQIDQLLNTTIRPGWNQIELNSEIFIAALANLFSERKKLVFTFTGTLEAEGFKIPIIYKYEP
jgi:hypothetical protein